MNKQPIVTKYIDDEISNLHKDINDIFGEIYKIEEDIGELELLKNDLIHNLKMGDMYDILMDIYNEVEDVLLGNSNDNRISLIKVLTYITKLMNVFDINWEGRY